MRALPPAHVSPDAHGLSLSVVLFELDAVCTSGILSEYSSPPLLPRQTGIYGPDDAMVHADVDDCVSTYAWL